MVTEIISALLGLGTGLFFERRAARATREQNEDLKRQLSVLKATIFSLGGGDRSGGGPRNEPQGDLPGLVTSRAIATQDSMGRVNRRALVAHFMQEGHKKSGVEAAISSLCATGAAEEEGLWLRMQ